MTEREKDRQEEREAEIRAHEGEPADPHGATNIITKPVAFVVAVIVCLLIFYVVAIYFGFEAYKEFKGLAEDVVGQGNLVDVNIIGYGTIVPAD